MKLHPMHRDSIHWCCECNKRVDTFEVYMRNGKTSYKIKCHGKVLQVPIDDAEQYNGGDTTYNWFSKDLG